MLVLDTDLLSDIQMQSGERIGAIVLAHDATLLTRNVRDFTKIPGLKFEDWSA